MATAGSQANPRSTALSTDGAFIEDDRKCPGCGYNLKGLNTGGNCPECGRIISNRRALDQGHMGEAPVRYLRLLSASFMIAGLGGLVLGVMTVIYIASLLLAVFDWNTVFASIALGASVLWCAGLVVPLLPRRTGKTTRRSREEDWSYLRYAAGATQAFWLVATAILFLGSVTGMGTLPSRVSGVIAVLGLAPVAILFARYADWASDTSLHNRFLACAWCISVFTGGGLLTSGLYTFNLGFGPFSIPFLVVFIVFGLASVLALMLFCFPLASNVRWAISNARALAERDRRLAEKAQREAERERRRAEQVGVVEPPVSEPPPVDEQAVEEVERRHREMSEEEVADADVIGTHHQKVIGPASGETYALEEPDEEDDRA